VRENSEPQNLKVNVTNTVCGEAWLARSDNVKLDYVLKGSNQLNYDENCSLFGFVQQFVLDTCRFC
jgi:hypothetical protein